MLQNFNSNSTYLFLRRAPYTRPVTFPSINEQLYAIVFQKKTSDNFRDWSFD